MSAPRSMLAILAALSLGVLACATILPGSSTRVVGSGNVIEETRSFEGINGVSLDTLGDMHIVLGGKEQLTIRAEDNILPYLETEIQGGVLHIRTQPNLGLSTTRPIEYTLTVISLDSIAATSLGNIVAPDLEAQNFSISASSSGDITLGELGATRVKINLSSIGSVDLAGIQAAQLDVSISSSGDLNIQAGQAKAQDIRLSSIGSYHAENVDSPPVEGSTYPASEFSVHIDSSGNAFLGSIAAEQADLETSSLGVIQIKALYADQLTVGISSTGDIEINGGTVLSQRITLSSVGDYNAAELSSQTAQANLSSSGSATIQVSETLQADLSSSGNLNYIGSPKVNASTTSSGDVIQIGK